MCPTGGKFDIRAAAGTAAAAPKRSGQEPGAVQSRAETASPSAGDSGAVSCSAIPVLLHCSCHCLPCCRTMKPLKLFGMVVFCGLLSPTQGVLSGLSCAISPRAMQQGNGSDGGPMGLVCGIYDCCHHCMVPWGCSVHREGDLLSPGRGWHSAPNSHAELQDSGSFPVLFAFAFISPLEQLIFCQQPR